MDKELKDQEKELSDEIMTLQKKVFECFSVESGHMLKTSQNKFYEKQFNDAQTQLRDIVSAFDYMLYIDS